MTENRFYITNTRMATLLIKPVLGVLAVHIRGAVLTEVGILQSIKFDLKL